MLLYLWFVLFFYDAAVTVDDKGWLPSSTSNTAFNGHGQISFWNNDVIFTLIRYTWTHTHTHCWTQALLPAPTGTTSRWTMAGRWLSGLFELSKQRREQPALSPSPLPSHPPTHRLVFPPAEKPSLRWTGLNYHLHSYITWGIKFHWVFKMFLWFSSHWQTKSFSWYNNIQIWKFN